MPATWRIGANLCRNLLGGSPATTDYLGTLRVTLTLANERSSLNTCEVC